MFSSLRISPASIQDKAQKFQKSINKRVLAGKEIIEEGA